MGISGLDLGMAKYSRYKVFSFSEGSKKVLSGTEWLLIHLRVLQLIHENETMSEQQVREFRKVVNIMKENYACLNGSTLEMNIEPPSIGAGSIELQESLVALVQLVSELKKTCIYSQNTQSA